jgi:3-oxoacyl-[acyl-carrier protein] reductase
MNSMELADKVAVITGASKGIGKAVALAMADEGAHVAISARSGDLLKAVESQIREKGRDVFSFIGDMSVEEEIKSFISGAHDHFKRMDILINNAGLGIFKSVADMETGDWDTMFNLNVRGLFIATRDSLPYLREAGESAVVNVVSLAGKNTFVKGAGYSATKHAVLAFSKCLMLEEREHGLRVLAICPGSVATHFSGDPGDKPDPRREKITQAEDVAASIIHMLRMPQRAMVSEIDIRPTNPA